MALQKQVRRLFFGVDSPETAEILQKAAFAHGLIAEVRMEVDTGAGCTGVPREQAVELAKIIESMPNLKLTGIYTIKSLIYQNDRQEV